MVIVESAAQTGELISKPWVLRCSGPPFCHDVGRRAPFRDPLTDLSVIPPAYASLLVVTPEQRDLILRAVYDVADGRPLQPVTVAEVAQYVAVPQGLVWESLNGFEGLVVAEPPNAVYLTSEGVGAAGRIPADIVASALDDRWWTIEYSILERTQRGERLGTDVDDFVTSHALGLPEPEFIRVATGMFEQGWLRGSPIRVEESLAPIGVRIHGLTAAGREEFRRRRPTSPTGDISAEVVAPEVRAAVETFVRRFEEAVEGGELDELAADDRADVMADVESLQAQMRSARPKRRVWVALLESIRTVLVSGAGTMLGAEAVQLLNRLH
ncbi:MAG: hypothetical protein ACYC1D_02615 [Acidimicrobiales bacterium]